MLFNMKPGLVEYTIYDDTFFDGQDEFAVLHSHGVDYGDLTADGKIAQLIITKAL